MEQPQPKKRHPVSQIIDPTGLIGAMLPFEFGLLTVAIVLLLGVAAFATGIGLNSRVIHEYRKRLVPTSSCPDRGYGHYVAAIVFLLFSIMPSTTVLGLLGGIGVFASSRSCSP